MSRTLNRLGNAKQVAAIKAPGWHGDGGGLFLRIRKDGARSWVLVRQAGGKRVERGLGGFDTISLADVRERARTFSDEKHEAEPSIPTFGDFTDRILPTFLPGFKNAKHRQQWENTLKTHGGPLRGLPIDRVGTDDVLAVLRPIWQHKNETARRLRGRIERILGAAKAEGLRPRDAINPAAWDDHLVHFLKAKAKRVKSHHAAMPFPDVPAFVAKLRARPSISALALELCILSATRTTETIAAQRKEFDLEALVWTIPEERMKMGMSHQVPLTPRMAEIVRQRAAGLSPDGFLFPGQVRTDRAPHLSNMAMIMMLRGMTGEKLTVHGFRSAFRDWAGDTTDHPREIAEMALAHSIGSDVEVAYRRSRALEKRRLLMQDWENFLSHKDEGALDAQEEAPMQRAKRPRRPKNDQPGQVSLFSA